MLKNTSNRRPKKNNIELRHRDVVNSHLSLNDPFIISYAKDLLCIYNAVIDILPEEASNKLSAKHVNLDSSSVIECMQLTRIVINDLVLIYKQIMYKYIQKYITELNIASEILYNKYQGFLGSAFAINTRGNNPKFISEWYLSENDFAELQYFATCTFTLLNEMAYIFYGEASMPIIITYRDEGKGSGATFDHYNIQRITGRPTAASIATGLESDLFTQYLASSEAPQFSQLIYILGEDQYGPEDIGMIVIPGFARSSLPLNQRPQPLHQGEYENKDRVKTHMKRIKHERQLMRSALRNSIPTLAICGGLQTMTETFGGKMKHLPPKKKRIHNQPMMNMLPSGKLTKVNPAHTIAIKPQSALYKHLHTLQAPPSLPRVVNYEMTSVHWFSVSKLPPNFTACAYASYPTSHTGKYVVDLAVIEALENKTSDDSSAEAPMIGIQGHPEAMDINNSRHPHAANYYSLFNSMAAEGDCRHKLRILFKKKETTMALAERLNTDSHKTSFNVF